MPPEGRPAAGPLDQLGLPAGEPADDPGQVNTWGHLTPGVVQLPLGDSGGLTGPATSVPRLSDADGGPLGVGSGPGMGLSGTGTLAEASSNHSELLIVGHQAGGGGFSSLAAACGAAGNGNVIELRYDGRHEEQPLRLANLRVTIRAGEGYRPVIVFRPTEPDPVKCPRSMIAAAGRLTLIGVAIELQVPREVPADQWSLLETRGDAVVSLKKCALVIDNASEQLGTYQQDVAFVRTRAAPGADTVLDDGTAAPIPPAKIELVDCTAAGEAVFLRVEDLQPVHLSWNNGLLATTERLLSAGGGTRTPQAGQKIQVDLSHVTALVRGGLCRIASSPTGPHPLPLQCSCTDSILLGRAGGPLLEQIGQGEVDNFRQQIAWTGDRNCYDGFDVLLVDRPQRRRSAAGADGFCGLEEPLGGAGESASVGGGPVAEVARGQPAPARLHAGRLRPGGGRQRRPQHRLPGGSPAAARRQARRAQGEGAGTFAPPPQ